jgi:uncharacterized protein YceH (UPF0502 family)
VDCARGASTLRSNMLQLTPDESRVLGVLIEKALTTPEQYPLSLNAVVNGANQKNNRDPVLAMEEGEAVEALEGLRSKGMVVRSDMAGSRVNKYRHQAADVLHVRTAELVILAELLLRGPQTLGELRGRASRMHPLESLDIVKSMLRALQERDEPLVRELPPAPGSRAERCAQLLCPDLHPLDAPVAAPGPEAQARAQPTAVSSFGGASMAERVQKLEREVDALRLAVRRLAEAVGEKDPLAPAERAAST